MDIVFTKDQENALKEFAGFLDSDEKYMVIQGKSGTGKTTLTHALIRVAENHEKVKDLICGSDDNSPKKNFINLGDATGFATGFYRVQLTATTNQAVKVLSELSSLNARTIHSYMGVVPRSDFKTGKTHLAKTANYNTKQNVLLFIDEYSMIDDILFKLIDSTFYGSCKIVLIGDKHQLVGIKQVTTIVTNTLKCLRVELNETVRNPGNIQKAGEEFRIAVETGIFSPMKFSPEVLNVNGPEFKKMINEEFVLNRLKSSKIVAWTNAQVIAYNTYLRKERGLPELFTEGETVITNKLIRYAGKTILTDSEVIITKIRKELNEMGVEGRTVTLNDSIRAFLPNSQMHVKTLLKSLAKTAKAQQNWHSYYDVKDNWLDLRLTDASTVHKAQGSTYEKAFIDLPDIARCNIPSEVARMLYVAISRASKQVICYGKLPDKYKGKVP